MKTQICLLFLTILVLISSTLSLQFQLDNFLSHSVSGKEKENLSPVWQSSSIVINAPIQEVWKLLSDWAHWETWYKSFSSVKIIYSPPLASDTNAVGTIRECPLLSAGKYIREELINRNNEQHSFSYSMLEYKNASESPLPYRLLNHRTDVRLYSLTHGLSSGQTFVQWSIRYITDTKSLPITELTKEKIFGALFVSLEQYFQAHPTVENQNNFYSSESNLKTSRLHIQQGAHLPFPADLLWDAFSPASGESTLWTNLNPPQASLSANPEAIPRREYNFEKARTDVYLFPIIEDQVSTDSAQKISKVSLELKSSPLESLNGVTSHVGKRFVFPVNFPLDSTPSSVVIFEDEFQISNSNVVEAVDFFHWLSNGIIDHVNEVLTSPRPENAA